MEDEGKGAGPRAPGAEGARPWASALEQLQQGNLRFVEGRSNAAHLGAKRKELIDKQEPFAIILGCSDSRVPAEIVFDQGLGDLFVIRVAGNIVAPSQIGSVEFAVERFGTDLVVVLGHSNCGAIIATLEELRRPTESQSPNLRAIVERVRPAVEHIAVDHDPQDPTAIAMGVKANIAASVDALRNGSEILQRSVSNGDLMIVGAEYSLETGAVEFLTPPQ